MDLLCERVENVLLEYTRHVSTSRMQRYVQNTQIIQRVLVETPAYCGTNASIKTSANSQIEANRALEDIRETSVVEVRDRIVQAAEAWATERGSPVRLTEDTRRVLLDALKSGQDRMIVQQQLAEQSMTNIRVRACHVVLNHTLVTSTLFTTYKEEACRVIEESEEWIQAFPKSKPPKDETAGPPSSWSSWGILLSVLLVIVGLLLLLFLLLYHQSPHDDHH